MPRIFLSHSGKDNRPSAALNKWLTAQDSTLRRQIFLDIDRDMGMVGGEEWKETIRRNLASCQALLILVSDNWDDSKECYSEYDNAEAAGKKIYCARLQDSAGLGRIAKYQRRELYVVDDEPTTTIDLGDGKPPVVFATDGLERLLLDISRRKRGADAFVWPPPGEPDRAPYRGWAPFEPRDAAVYFGRDAEVDNAVEQLEGVQEAARSKLFVILGPSGTGKSSFLRAGVLPRLALDTDRFIVMDVVRPGRDEAITGAMGLAASIHSLRARHGLDAPSLGELKAQWIQDPVKVRELLVECQEFCSDEEASPALVLPLDQAEELFSSESGPEARALLGLARDLFTQGSTDSLGRQPLRLVIVATIRTDRYEVMQTAEQFLGVDTQLFNDLKPLRADRLSQVIQGPARRSTEGGRPLSVEVPLVDRLLADAANGTVGGDTLPLLSGTLSQLYADYHDTGLLTLGHYEQLGGMSHVVQTKIDKILSIDPAERAAQLATLREAFIPYLATVSDDDEPLRRIALWRDLPPASIHLIDDLVDARILTKDRRRLDGHTGEQDVVEIALESFLRQWDALAGWLRDEREDLKAADELLRAASRWQASDRHPDYLHPAALLDKVEALAASATFSRKLEPTREFLVASRKSATDDRDAKERTLRRNALRLRLVLAVAVVVALGAVAAFVWARASQQVAQRNAQDATAQKLTAEAQASLKDASVDDDVKAMKKLLAANALADQPDEQPLLEAVISRYAMLKALRVNDSVVGVAFAGHRLAMAHYSGLEVWDTSRQNWQDRLAEPDIRFDVGAGDSSFTSVAVSPDGRTLVAGTASGWARRWGLDEQNRTAKPVLQQHQGRVTSVAVSTDGRIASAGVDGVIALTGPAGDEASAPPPIQLGGEVFSVAFSPAGDQLAVGGANGAIHLFGMHGANVLAGQVKPAAHRDGVMSVAFSPDGRTLLSGGADRMVRLWNAEDITAPPIKELQGHTATVTSVAFNVEGTRIASVSNDRTVRLWDVASGKRIGDPMRGHVGLVVAVAFVGDVVVSGGNEHTMRLWDGARGQPLSTPISSQTGPVTGVALSPDGAEVAASGTDSTVRLWSADTGSLVDSTPPHTHTGIVTGVAFSPVERLVASAGSDGTVALWRPGSGRAPSTFDAGRPLTSVAFSPTGARVAAAGVDGQIVEWDVRSGRRTFLKNDDDATVTAIAFAPNDDRLASVSVGGTLRMWRPDGTEAWHEKPAEKLPADTRKAEYLATDYPNALNTVAFSLDGSRVATGGADWVRDGGAVGFVQLWNSADGSVVGSPIKVGSVVMSVAFNPADDHGLVVASFDPYEVQLWNTEAHQAPRYTFTGHESQVVGVAVSKDGRRIVSGSADGSVRIWPNLPAGKASDALCAKLTTPITERDWPSLVAADLPFKPTCQGPDAGVVAKPS